MTKKKPMISALSEPVSMHSGWPGPFKCPDCQVWWTGFEHRCSSAGVTYSASANFGHCHGCSSAWCPNADHVPCQLHVGGWTTSHSDLVGL